MGVKLSKGDRHCLDRALALDGIDCLKMLSKEARHALRSASIETVYEFRCLEPYVLDKLDVSDKDRIMIEAVQQYLVEDPTFP